MQLPRRPAHDLGLYELLFTIVMTVILFAYNRKPRPPGRIIALAALMYAPARFVLDFLRATDVARPDERYLGADAGAVGLPGHRRARRLPLASRPDARAAAPPRRRTPAAGDADSPPPRSA